MNKSTFRNLTVLGRKKLKSEIIEAASKKGVLMEDEEAEKLTYTWFIRFALIKYLEIKGYIDSILYIFLEQDIESKINIVVQTCTELSCIFPKIFDNNVSIEELELLVFLHKKNSFIYSLLQLSEDYFQSPEVIGWLHQFYYSEEHENIVGMNNGTISFNDIPKATQVFTPKWIVQYMVDNSLGRLWVGAKKDFLLKEKLQFYIEDREDNIEVSYKIAQLYEGLEPQDIKFLDPTCGSGHILAYAFDILFEIYLSKGYKKEEICELIIENNLYGMDIDENVVKIAEAVVILKCREKDFCFLNKITTKKMNINIIFIKASRAIEKYKNILMKNVHDLDYGEKQIDNLVAAFYEGNLLGSLLEIKGFDESFWMERIKFLDENYKDAELSELKEEILHLVKQSCILSRSYHVVCTNPPYLSKKYMNSSLKKFLKNNYKVYNGDLFSVFMIRNLKFTRTFGFSAFLTPFVWMFIKEYEELRKYIIEKKELMSLIQLEYSAFAEATVPVCAFVVGNFHENFHGEYIKLSEFKGHNNQPLKILEAIKNPKVSYRYSCLLSRFKEIPGTTIAYWASQSLLDIFKKSKKLKEFIDVTGSQNITSDNIKYLRKHWELDTSSINKRWCLYTKGGDYRKWYGNLEYLVDWSREAKEYYKINKTSNLLEEKYCFRDGITYNGISTKGFAVRVSEKAIYDKGGPTFHMLDESLKYYMLALLNSKVIATVMQLYNPTINYQVQDIKNVPIILTEDKEIFKRVEKLALECIEISRSDWDYKETSLNFKYHPLMRYSCKDLSFREACSKLEKELYEKFSSLKSKEEELNEIFIRLYDLEGILNKNVNEEDITISKFSLNDTIKNFISYAVGCIMGRYNLRENNEYKAEISEILTLNSEKIWSRNITDEFVKFMGDSFGKSNIIEDLDFLTQVLGRKDKESSIEALKRYFYKYFYKDHIRIFKDKPIYWLFTSGKNMTFSALVYYHRLNDLTINILRTCYVDKLIIDYEERISKLKHELLKLKHEPDVKIIIRKKIKKLETSIEELKSYSKALQKAETEEVSVDLNDGVSYNYSKFHSLVHKL